MVQLLTLLVISSILVSDILAATMLQMCLLDVWNSVGSLAKTDGFLSP